MSLEKRDPICWECGASNTPGSSECWLCQRRDWNRYPGPRRRHPSPPDLPRRRPLSTIAGWMIAIAVIGVAIGLFREAPGVAILLLVSVVPALAITELKARGRLRRGDPMSAWERIARILALTILIPILVIGALAIALFTFCLFLSLR
jgi:hypothetical protein